MTYAPDTLRDLGAYWTAHGGVNLGVVGDAGHVGRGVSYHLGADQLTATAYSRVLTRDKQGLTNAASAIDLGKLNGSLTELRKFSVNLVAIARANAPGTSDMREIIYSPDGATVLRWDRERGYSSAPKAGEADTSHLTHTHISWYRDAEARDHRTAFLPYFEEDLVNSFPVPKGPAIGDVAKGVVLYTSDALSATDTGRITVDPARSLPYLGRPRIGVLMVEYVDEAGVHSGKSMFVKSTVAEPGLTNIRPLPVPVTDCAPLVKAAVDPLNAQIATLAGQVTAAQIAGQRAEWDRQKAGATVSLLARP